MTPLQALLLARQHGVAVRVVDGQLHIGADTPVPRHVVEALRQHRDRLIEMLALDQPLVRDWRAMVQDLAEAHIHLDAAAANRARTAQHQSLQPDLDTHAARRGEPQWLYWQAFDHVCHTRCERQHSLCNACGQPLPRPWLHWPWLHGECRLEQVDQ